MKLFKRILLVDDDSKDIEMTMSALSVSHLVNDIQVARDGVEALDYLYRRGKFAQETDGYPVVILLDLKMPKLDGVQVLKQIKSDDNLKSIPVVILTSSRESKDLETCYKLGANGYVVKPVKFADFVETVREIGVFWGLINEPPPGCGRKSS